MRISVKGVVSARVLAGFLAILPAMASAQCEQLCDPAFYATATPASVQQLIDAGADVNAEGSYGKTPLGFIGGAPAGIVSVLIQAGADVNAHDQLSRMPIHFISATGTPEALSLLIAAGADVNASTANAWTPLHGAAKYGGPENILVLINAGADASLRTEMGETPFDLTPGNQRMVGTDALGLLEQAQ